MEGTVLTQGNILAKEGGSVILQCHLSSTTANVTQVNWEQQDQLLAIYHPHFGWYINPILSDRVSPGPREAIAFHSLTTNDTGEYFCIYHTYPDGIYRGRIFLEVQGSSGMCTGAEQLMNLFLQHRKHYEDTLGSRTSTAPSTSALPQELLKNIINKRQNQR